MILTKTIQLVAGYGDGIVRLWDLNTFECKREFSVGTSGDPVWNVRMDGTKIVEASCGKEIGIHNIEPHTTAHLWPPSIPDEARVTTLQFTEAYVAAGYSNGAVTLFDFSPDNIENTPKPNEPRVTKEICTGIEDEEEGQRVCKRRRL